MPIKYYLFNLYLPEESNVCTAVVFKGCLQADLQLMMTLPTGMLALSTTSTLVGPTPKPSHLSI